MRTIYPQPGHTEAELVALLASRNFAFVDCYTIAPAVGAPLYYATARSDVTVVPIGGTIRQTYGGGKVLVSGLRSRTKIGVEVDEQIITLDYSRDNDYQSQMPWAKALLLGRLDGAKIKRHRFFAEQWLPDWQQPWIAGIKMFDGIVSGLRAVGRQSAQISVKSAINILDTQMPRDLYTPNCKNTWGDAGCGVDKNSYAVTAACTSAATSTFLPWTSATVNYTDGFVHIDNGDSVTRVRKILKGDATGLSLAYPLDFVPMIGQVFTAWPGCSGTTTRCQDFHGGSWQNFYKGFPFVPVSETAV